MEIIKSLINTVEWFGSHVTRPWETSLPGWRLKFRTAIGYVMKGYLSDPPHLSMYTLVKVISEEYGVCQWRCHRGTSVLEGYHLHYRAFFHSTSLNMGPRLHELMKTVFDFR